MRIGLLSDTHLVEAEKLWPEIFRAFAGVDLILHAGDIMFPAVLDALEQLAPVFAAEGNHDYYVGRDPRVSLLHTLELEGHSLALLHQFEPLDWGMPRLSTKFLRGERPDIVVYGDSHYDQIDVLDGTLIVNPGSPILPRNMSPRLGHVGFLTLERGAPPQAELVHLAAYTRP